MPCDTHSVSSSGALTVTLVHVRERNGTPKYRRGVIRRLRSRWRLVRDALWTTPPASPAAGTGPLDSRAAACFAKGVRPPLPLHDDWHDLMRVLPHTMRETC